MFTKPNWFVLLTTAATAVVAVCFVILLADLGDEAGVDGAADLDEAAKDRLASEMAIRQIAAESRRIDEHGTGRNADAAAHPALAMQAVAPPGFEPAPIAEYDPTPPDGYSFTAYHEATRLPLTDADLEDLRRPSPTPDWMGHGVDALADQAAAQGREWTFGWVKLAAGVDLGDLAGTLAAQGGDAIGQAGDFVRVRLPADRRRLEAIAAAAAVAAIGAVPPSEKVAETLAERALAEALEEAPVWITLMEDDPDGAWRRELQGLGAVVGQFDPAVRTYPATIPLAALAALARADFVLAVESIGRVRPAIHITTSTMAADAMRSYDAARGLFTGVGGASVPIGVMDSGLNIDHVDIVSNRRSICGANFAAGDARRDDQDLWYDAGNHGTAVTGVFAGSGSSTPVRAGMAPLVQDIRFAKAGGIGLPTPLLWVRSLDWLAKPTACGDDIPRKPLVVNSSLGILSSAWEARSNVERKIDATVLSARHLFVTSAGNTISTDPNHSSHGGAKNALPVGATLHEGDIAVFSSPGPTGDGRLQPKVVGSGVNIEIPAGSGLRRAYFRLSGTSFSAPAVAGVAALVMDAVPTLREEPAALRARLMASAVKPDGFLGAPSAFALDNTHGPGPLQNLYGLGKVSARTAILNRDTENGWVGGTSAFDVDPESYVSHEIVVPEGASRLEVVLTWDDPPADPIMHSVLHDLDLWVDWQGSCGAIPACGEFHSLSAVDNVEWVVVPDPPPGVYRVKVTPARVVGAPPRAGLAWTIIRGGSTPTLDVAANVDRLDVDPGEPFEVEATLTTDGYVAAGATLRVDCRAAVGSDACDGFVLGDESFARREDAVDRPLGGTTAKIEVGEIGPDERQVVTLRFPGRRAGRFQLYLAASAWNATSGVTSLPVVVGNPDGDSPEPIQRPPNDDYDSPTALAGEGGETTFDLVAATPGPGEPPYPLFGSEALEEQRHRQRHRSLWYLWTAPDHGPTRFTILQSAPNDYSESVAVEIFPDGPRTALEAIGAAKLGGGAVFYAEAGETYRIRLAIRPDALLRVDEDDEGNAVSRQAATPRLTMTWGPAESPENDYFAHAAVIEGGTGSRSGNNQTATTEAGEPIAGADAYFLLGFDSWSASVWHRWVAPASGDWRFSVDRRMLAVAVFRGDRVSDARLVSGAPAAHSPDEATFPATQGEEYHIAVAATSAYFSGTDFTLSWEPGRRDDPANDDFAAAQPVAGGFVATHVDFNVLTVEHGEPAESGVRTAWYAWHQPAAGRFTWEVQILPGGLPGLLPGGPPSPFGEKPLGDAPLQMSVFKGTELAALQPLATNPAGIVELRIPFDAETGESHAFALGLRRSAAHAIVDPVRMTMRWGPTPANDDLANAIALTGATGSFVGSNEFATSEPGERTGSLGDSSVWWTFEPADSGWIRFAAAGGAGIKLAVYRIGDDGSPELVAPGRSFIGVEPYVTFQAEAGVRYLIRLSSFIFDALAPGGRARGPFTLSWAPTDPPALLRFVEAIRGDRADPAFAAVGQQAFNDEGTELYVASESRIVVFRRDPDTGGLTPVQTLAEAMLRPETQMLWDGAGAALLVASCAGWKRFTPVEGGGIESAGTVAGGPCPRASLLVDGPFVHNVVPPFMIETYRFNDEHTALTPVDQVMFDDIAKAVMTADGTHVYAVTAGSTGSPLLIAFERDAATGSLDLVSTLAEGSETGEAGTPVEGLALAQGLAVDSSHLFVSSGDRGAVTAAFDLADPANPAFVGTLDFGEGLSEAGRCIHLLARHDIAAVDTACRSSALVYTIQVGADRSLLPADLVSLTGIQDFFGNPVPHNRDARSFEASPDGRHVYVAGQSRELVDRLRGIYRLVNHILVFERRLGG